MIRKFSCAFQNKIEVGDVLEEVLGEPTKDMKLGRVRGINMPVYIDTLRL